MQARIISPECADWSRFLSRTPHDFYHLPEYVRLDAAHQGGEALAFIAEEADHGLLIPLIVRPAGLGASDGGPWSDAIGPYGYGSPLYRAGSAGDAAGFARAAIERFIEELCALRVVSAFIRLHPILPAPLEALTRSGAVVHHGETVVIDLTTTPEEMWQQTRDNHRRGIRKAERDGYSVEIDAGFREIDTFHEIYSETMQRVGAGGSYSFPLAYFRGLEERLSGNVHLCVVRIGGEVACGGIFAESCGMVQYHLGGTRNAYLKHQPSKLMFHFIRGWARERGNTALVLGAGVGGRNDELFHFKAGFSPLCMPFRTWRLIVERAAYEHLARTWADRHGIEADGPEGFFPAYRKAVGGRAGSGWTATPPVSSELVSVAED